MSKNSKQAILEDEDDIAFYKDEDFDDIKSVVSSEPEDEGIPVPEDTKYLAENLTAKQLLEMTLREKQQIAVKYPFDPKLGNKQLKPEMLTINKIKNIPATRELPQYKEISFTLTDEVLNMYCANCVNCKFYKATFSVTDCEGCTISGGRKRNRSNNKINKRSTRRRNKKTNKRRNRRYTRRQRK